MKNLEIYNAISKVPEEAQKKITGGRLNGMTDIKPMWRIEKLTEMFGICGFGWKTNITNKEIIEGANGEKIAIVDIELFIKIDGEWSEAILGTGGSSFIAKEKNGLYTSDECFKMAYTDAISVACKSLGMGAEIYWGDSKYQTTEEPTIEEAKEYVLTFGKHNGKKLSEVDDSYLVWLRENSKDQYIKKCVELLKPLPSEEEQKEMLELIQDINNLLETTNTNRESFYKYYKVSSNGEMTLEQLKDAREKLLAKVE